MCSSAEEPVWRGALFVAPQREQSNGPRERGRSLSAAGRASMGFPGAVAAGGGVNAVQKLHDEQHRAYLQALQEKSRLQRLKQEEERERNKDRLSREQGFSVCFSGANARKSSSAERSRMGRIGYGGGMGGPRQWEDATVEIKSSNGEVIALRPTGQRRERPPLLGKRPATSSDRCISPTALDPFSTATPSTGSTSPRGVDLAAVTIKSQGSGGLAPVEEAAAAAVGQAASPSAAATRGAEEEQSSCSSRSPACMVTGDGVPAADLSATQQELRGLRQELVEAGLAAEEPDAIVGPSSSDLPVSADVSRPTSPVTEPSVLVETEARPGPSAEEASVAAEVDSRSDDAHVPPAEDAQSSETIEDTCPVAEEAASIVADKAHGAGSTCVAPDLVDLAQRLERLSPEWQASLLRLLERAESGEPPPT